MQEDWTISSEALAKKKPMIKVRRLLNLPSTLPQVCQGEVFSGRLEEVPLNLITSSEKKREKKGITRYEPIAT